MKKILFVFFMMMFFLPLSASAEWIIDIFNKLKKTYELLDSMKNQDRDQLNKLKDINDHLDTLRRLNIQLNNSLIGKHNYGSQNYDVNRFNWGKENNWQSILALVNNGGGNNDLGSYVRRASNQFPIRDSLGSNDVQNEYYRMQAQTTIASRASSQLAFDQLNSEYDTMQQLHKLIDATNDNKSAVDLNNRLVTENAMINLQQAKLMAVLVQQVSIDAQEKANRAKANAEFFDIK
jgi:hypothetical protein